MQPWAMFGVLAFGAVVVPLIEEIFKPAGVWLLAGRPLSARAGFVIGALGGAGYAIFESLALSSSGEQWAGLVSARIGTGLVHILTAALTGWAIARAWKTRRYWLLGVAYLAAVTIHSLWNGLTLFYSFTLLAQLQGLLVRPVVLRVGEVVPYALAGLALVCLAFLVLANRSLVRQAGAKLATRAVADDLSNLPASAAADQQTEIVL
jgi:hypothetical protein